MSATAFIASVNPRAPDSCINCNSEISFPFKSLVIDPVQKIFANATSLAFLLIEFINAGRSITGFVFGIQINEVIPPQTADLEALLMVSLCS